MSDVTVAEQQDAIAESLLGEPETQDQAVESPGTEQIESEIQEPSDVEQEQTTEETADDWLPSEQEKVFPDEVLAKYAQRYGRDEQWLTDPQNRQLIVDKINSDIYLRQQQQTEEYQEPEPEQQQEPTPPPQVSLEQHFANLASVIEQRTDPQVAKMFHGEFLRAFGVPESEIAKVPPQQAAQFTHTASKFMLNLVNTFLPDMLTSQLGQVVSQVYPGFSEMHERSSYAMAWDKIRNSNPQYGTLPSYGTREFSKALHDATDKFPELVAAFQGPDGKIPISKAQSAYSLLAKIASGQTVDPALLQRAAAAGAKNSRRAQATRSNGNLGSGQSKAASGSRNSSQFQSNQDIFDDATMALYRQQHGRL